MARTWLPPPMMALYFSGILQQGKLSIVGRPTAALSVVLHFDLMGLPLLRPVRIRRLGTVTFRPPALSACKLVIGPGYTMSCLVPMMNSWCPQAETRQYAYGMSMTEGKCSNLQATKSQSIA